MTSFNCDVTNKSDVTFTNCDVTFTLLYKSVSQSVLLFRVKEFVFCSCFKCQMLLVLLFCFYRNIVVVVF